MNGTEHCLRRLHEKDDAQAAPRRTYHAAKISTPRANERVIIVMIRFPCTSQIRCVNIIKNISLCSADLQQFPPGILVLSKDNKLALISFPTHCSEFFLSPLCQREREGLCWTSPWDRGLWGMEVAGLVRDIRFPITLCVWPSYLLTPSPPGFSFYKVRSSD